MNRLRASSSIRASFLATLAFCACAGAASEASADPSYTLFESGQVRPLAMSPNGKYLFAANTPDNRLEVFRVKKGELVHTASVPVGLEPVAVAARSNTEVWVVNHLSDSVSVVELSHDATRGHVERTLLVGDEPRDIVFAGPGRKRAFITTARRGQNLPIDPQLTTEGVGRAHVWVFDSDALGDTLGGTPLHILTLFTDTPRALAVTPDGKRVYAAGFHTGNQTTTVSSFFLLPFGFGPDGAPGPATSASGDPAPPVGTIVKWNGAHWVDALGRERDQYVRHSQPDKDVFAIDAMSNPPKEIPGPGGVFTGVGTVLFNMVVNPVSKKVYVANTEANNHDRFEGPGIFAGHSLRGHLHESRITVLAPGGGVQPRHLNKHIDYDIDGQLSLPPTPNPESVKSLALPQSMAVTANGKTLYVSALGSAKVGVFSTAALENDTFVPSASDHIAVTGGGPTGLVLDEARKQVYVLTRFDNSVSVLDTKTRTETAHVPMHNPEPPSITEGRRFLYDASISSTHGDSSCASCHVFGDLDSLAWDLGNPDGEMLADPGPFISSLANLIGDGQPLPEVFHPMKGPMATQSLRGMDNHGPMHWRGDRTGGNDEPTAQPDAGSFDETAAFMKFRGAFAELLGRNEPLPEEDMEKFTDFILQLRYPPNPIRPLDNVPTVQQANGQALFEGVACGIDPPSPCPEGEPCEVLTCASCHVLDPDRNPGVAAPGVFGSDGSSSFAFNFQIFKVPHFRNLYQKVGMFGLPVLPVFLTDDGEHKGDQVRGFGFMHDGGMDTLFRFHAGISFSEAFTGPGNGGIPVGPEAEVQRAELEAFMLAFPTNFAPIVGQQITLAPSNQAAVSPRVDLLRQRAEASECDLVAKVELLGLEMGFLYVGAGHFASDRQALPLTHHLVLKHLATTWGQPVTYTCVPPGDGARIGIDRDGDGFLDGDERDAGSDPADPSSTP